MQKRERMIRFSDRTMQGWDPRRYYENSGFCNLGYWGGGAKSQREASEQLVDQLVARIPKMLRVDWGPPRNGWR